MCWRLPTRRLALAMLFASGMSAGRALAAELTWIAPSDCGDASRVRAQVEQLVHRSLPSVENLDFEVHIERGQDQRWRLSLRTLARPTGPERMRELSGANCQDVQDAAAIAIAMTIGASEQAADLPPADAEPAPASSAEVAPVPASPRQLMAASPARSGAPLRVALGVGLALELGLLPALAPGAELALSAGLSVLRVVALGTVFADQRARVQGNQGADFGLVLAAVLACFELPLVHFRGLGCAGFELGRLSIDAVDLALDDTRARLVYGPRAELGVIWQATANVGVLVRAGASLSASRYEFFVDRQERLHQPSLVSVRTTLGLEYSF